MCISIHKVVTTAHNSETEMLAQRMGKLVRMRRAAVPPTLGVRRLASKKAAAPADEAGASSAGEPRVTKEMVAREAKEMAKLMIGVRVGAWRR